MSTVSGPSLYPGYSFHGQCSFNHLVMTKTSGCQTVSAVVIIIAPNQYGFHGNHHETMVVMVTTMVAMVTHVKTYPLSGHSKSSSRSAPP